MLNILTFLLIVAVLIICGEGIVIYIIKKDIATKCESVDDRIIKIQIELESILSNIKRLQSNYSALLQQHICEVAKVLAKYKK